MLINKCIIIGGGIAGYSSASGCMAAIDLEKYINSIL